MKLKNFFCPARSTLFFGKGRKEAKQSVEEDDEIVLLAFVFSDESHPFKFRLIGPGNKRFYFLPIGMPLDIRNDVKVVACFLLPTT